MGPSSYRGQQSSTNCCNASQCGKKVATTLPPPRFKRESLQIGQTGSADTPFPSLAQRGLTDHRFGNFHYWDSDWVVQRDTSILSVKSKALQSRDALGSLPLASVNVPDHESRWPTSPDHVFVFALRKRVPLRSAPLS